LRNSTDAAERLDQVEQRRLGQLVLVAPGHVAEDAGERFGVGLLDAVEDLLQGHAHVLGHPAQVGPVAAVGNGEAVVVGLDLGVEAVTPLGRGGDVLGIPRVADALVEQQREDVRLEVRRVDRPPQRARGGPQPALELLLRHPCRLHAWILPRSAPALSSPPDV